MPKYTVESNPSTRALPNNYGSVTLWKAAPTEKYPDQLECIAVFFGPNAYTNAQKVCDLLNETSRSKGVYPK